jgi:hypothetical protein
VRRGPLRPRPQAAQGDQFPRLHLLPPAGRLRRQTERALKEAGIEYTVGKIPFVAIGKAIAAGEPEGFAKLLYGKKHGELLGAHIIGDNATELIAEMGLALDQELTAEEIHATIHAHPTMSEVIHEATLAAEGHAIHFSPNPKSGNAGIKGTSRLADPISLGMPGR